MFFFFKQKTAYEMRISDWSSDVCSSDLLDAPRAGLALQHLLEIFLQPVLPDLVAGRDVQRILGLLIFLGVRGADIADQVADRGPGRIIARKAALRRDAGRSEEHTSELQSLMRISYAVFCLKKQKQHNTKQKAIN